MHTTGYSQVENINVLCAQQLQEEAYEEQKHRYTARSVTTSKLQHLSVLKSPSSGGRFGLGEVQHLDVLLWYRGLEHRSGNDVPNLLKRECLWPFLRMAIRALPEG
ncbi:hypothetical protein EVAR_69968_1 [Eumeta japonica]|uniref:Uncharacterized protein n=1 Tax=Eumeta variegata TaxID=151549 RepID=A0A4C2AI47_EUMVA|nr:hypothetical protein EVAR_69968_1 [Eumeta japonica]